MEPFVGEIRLVGFKFAPSGWMTCDGQLLKIGDYEALFTLLGTQFGGDGTTTFALPDLRGRTAIHQGTGNNLSKRDVGQVGGEEAVILTADQMPAHSHTVNPAACNEEAGLTDPTDAIPANNGNANYLPAHLANVAMGGATSSVQGRGESHDNMPPFQVVNFIIALNGIYPSQS
ncbi:MAG: phage tail protein [Fibrella sp.]|nr:phage tail protein [Armatimonadota bacterium]